MRTENDVHAAPAVKGPRTERMVRRAGVALALVAGTLLTGYSVSDASPSPQPQPEPTAETTAYVSPTADSAMLARDGGVQDTAQLAALRVQARNASAHQGLAALPDCTGQAPVQAYGNGQMPAEAMCAVPGVAGGQLRADAAVAFARLNAEYAATFGTPMCVGDTYRSYEEQVGVKARRGAFAATPGTSTHGWGLAVDLCKESANPGAAQWQWVDANAATFGFTNPDWARQGGSGPYEPWHWEFSDAVAEQRAATV